jgi:hypothetical protein
VIGVGRIDGAFALTSYEPAAGSGFPIPGASRIAVISLRRTGCLERLNRGVQGIGRRIGSPAYTRQQYVSPISIKSLSV